MKKIHGFNFLTDDTDTNPLVKISIRQEIMFWDCYLLGNLDCQNWYPDPIEMDFGLSKIPFPKIPIPSQ